MCDSHTDDEALRGVPVLGGVAQVANAQLVHELELLLVLSQAHLSVLTLDGFAARVTEVPEQLQWRSELSHLSDQASLPC